MKQFVFSFVAGFALVLCATIIISSNEKKTDYKAFEKLYHENKAQIPSFNLKSLKECNNNTLNQCVLLEDDISL